MMGHVPRWRQARLVHLASHLLREAASWVCRCDEARAQVGGALAGEAVVALTAGYRHWLALTQRGRVISCATGDDGYAAGLAGAPAGAPSAGGELGRPTRTSGADASSPGMPQKT